MKQSHEDFLRILSDYQGIIHKVNLIYFKTVTDREDNFQEVVYLWKSFSTLKDKEKIIYIDKSIAYQKKYDTSISIGLTLFIVGIFIIQNYILHGTIILFTLIAALITVSIALYLSYVRKKRFKEVRNYLQSLYDLL